MTYELLKFITINFMLLKYFEVAIATEFVQKPVLNIKRSMHKYNIVTQDTLFFS